MGVISCHRLLGVSSFVLEVRSWSGNDVPVNLYQMNVILCPDQKGQSPKAQPSPSKVQVKAKRREKSVSSSFRARFPHPAQLSPLKEPGTQPSWSWAPSGGPNGETRSHRSGRRPLLLGHRDRDGGGSPLLKACAMASGGPWWGPWSPRGVAPSLFPGPSSSPAGPRLGELEDLQERPWICLLLQAPPDDHHTSDRFLNHFPSASSLTVTCEQGPLRCWPIA